jgi:uncharacterized protein YndB with AHSA1/START domain
MDQIQIYRDFEQSAERLWSYLTDHEGLVRWSGLRSVRVLRDVAAGGTGTVRRAELTVGPIGPLLIDEEICAHHPPHRLEYRVTRGLPLSHHYTILTLEPRGAGTRLHWRVHYAWRFPAPRRLIKRWLEKTLHAALERLDRLVRAELPCASIGPASAGEAPSVELATQLAERTATLRATALRFRRADSRHYWFARVYERLHSALLAMTDERRFLNPSWVLALSLELHDHYARNLERWEAGDQSSVDPHWREAFELAERPVEWWGHRHEAALAALRRAVWAHVCEDLPRALALTYWTHYHGQPGHRYDCFEEDYVRIAPCFDNARTALERELPPANARERLLRGALPAQLARSLGLSRPLDLSKERRRAWARGQGLVDLLEAGIKQTPAAPLVKDEQAQSSGGG